MAKAHSDTTEQVKRAPRRRVPRKTTRVSTRVRATEPVAENDSETEVSPRRKSPTVITPHSDGAVSRLSVNRGFLLSVGTVLLCFVVAIFIGVSDAGQIDISAVVNNQNSQVQSDQGADGDGEGEGQSATTIPVQNNTSNLPSGGLRPSTAQPTAPVTATTTENTASTTATTTGAVASSTAEISESEAVSDSTTDDVTETNEEVVTETEPVL